MLWVDVVLKMWWTHLFALDDGVKVVSVGHDIIDGLMRWRIPLNVVMTYGQMVRRLAIRMDVFVTN